MNTYDVMGTLLRPVPEDTCGYRCITADADLALDARSTTTQALIDALAAYNALAAIM